MNLWLKGALVIAVLWVAYSELMLFFKTRRTRIATIDFGTPLAEGDNPGLFKRNMWSRLIGSILITICVIAVAIWA